MPKDERAEKPATPSPPRKVTGIRLDPDGTVRITLAPALGDPVQSPPRIPTAIAVDPSDPAAIAFVYRVPSEPPETFPVEEHRDGTIDPTAVYPPRKSDRIYYEVEVIDEESDEH